MGFNRRGEQGNFPFRSQRLCCENGEWYFHTREGTLNGPFTDRQVAEKALAVFVAQRILEASANEQEAAEKVVEIEDGLRERVEELLGFFRSRSSAGLNAALAWAHNRIGDLRKDSPGTAMHKDRIDILLFAMDQDQHFAHR